VRVAGARPAAPAANGRADARGGHAPPEDAPRSAPAQPSASSEAGGGGGGGKDAAREGLEARIEQLEMDLLKACGTAGPPSRLFGAQPVWSAAGVIAASCSRVLLMLLWAAG